MIRSFIHILSRHSNWKTAAVKDALEQEVYAGPKQWHTIARSLLLSLGVGWLVAGIVFFFAFNWDQLHPFAKMGLVQGLFLIFSLLAWKSSLSPLIKNIVLTGAAVLIGVMFAVFGQIYQTGANAYDFFLSWFLCIVLWTIYCLFEPMWLLMMVLANITLGMYIEQETSSLQDSSIFIVFVALNLLLYGLIRWLNHSKNALTARWLLYVLQMWIATLLVFGFGIGIFGKIDSSFWYFILLMIACMAAATWVGFQQRNIFLLVITGLSVMMVVTLLLSKWLTNS
ncbi:MAG: DUF2157 domain-containing protein, partial [Sediminibacterium sp.]|nr:DUF2157 domain-containing protein [Sediminibacterium sp.]